MLKEEISTNVRPLRLVIEELLRPIIESNCLVSRDPIYACALGVLVSNINLNFQEILTHESN